jgi:hypothetical protein
MQNERTMMLRLPAALHAAVHSAARRDERSVSNYVRRVLARAVDYREPDAPRIRKGGAVAAGRIAAAKRGAR